MDDLYESDIVPEQFKISTTSSLDPASFIVVNPKSKSRLHIVAGQLHIDMTKPMPNRFIRFWYRALLGWQWESLEQ